MATIKDDGTKSDHSGPAKAKATSIKLPKLSIPKFDGDILNWRAFWEQFQVSIHNRHQLSDAEKLPSVRVPCCCGILQWRSDPRMYVSVKSMKRKMMMEASWMGT